MPRGNYECIYTNMPAVGLGKVLPVVDATGRLATATGRFNAAPAPREGA